MQYVDQQPIATAQVCESLQLLLARPPSLSPPEEEKVGGDTQVLVYEPGEQERKEEGESGEGEEQGCRRVVL